MDTSTLLALESLGDLVVGLAVGVAIGILAGPVLGAWLSWRERMQASRDADLYADDTDPAAGNGRPVPAASAAPAEPR